MSDCTHTKYEGCKPCPCDTVTITISRNEAEWWAMHRPMPEQFGNFFERQIQKACRAALEGER